MNHVKDNDGPHAIGRHRDFFTNGDPANRDQAERYFIATSDGGTTRLYDGVHWSEDAEDFTGAEYISVDSLTLTNND